ncbi:MAG TPA: efflux transporter outer membrane subunit [Steroidobacteraceae bacterium]|nr:efflux transporter outer membrane subunit [Steroidobacteraceae bacterium]
MRLIATTHTRAARAPQQVSHASAARTLWAMVLALGLGACSLGPAYRKPDIPPPAAWQASTQEPVAWPSTEWWRGFKSAELDDLIAGAERANDDLAAAVARVHQAEAQVRIDTAPLLPTLDASGTGTRQRQFLPVGAPLLYNLFNTQLSAAYQLDFWGKNRAVRAAALATEAANRYDRETVELTVMTNVASGYFTVLELRDRLSVARENVASATTILRGLRIDESVGTTTALDVAQQETVVATLSAAIPPLEQQLRQTLDALAILIGREPQQFDITSGSLDDVSHPAVNPGLPAELLARRPDVASAEAQLIAANADIQAARATFFPNIELTAAGGFESTTLEHLLEPGSRIYSISAGITQPIFHGGALLGQYQFSKARYAELLADYHKAVISAFGNVEDALSAVQRSADQLQRQQNAVDVARRAYQMSQAQFRAGTVNILTVLNTETALFSAEDALAQVKLAHLQALVGLFNALGGGWQR